MKNEAREWFDEQKEQLKDVQKRMRKETGLGIIGLAYEARALHEELREYKNCDLAERKLVI